jgi:hypothetical protein
MSALLTGPAQLSADDAMAHALDAPGTARLAIDAMLRVASCEWSDEVASACVECASTPRMLLNPAFVTRHCGSARSLAFLILHELSHVSLGHTGLHPRVTPAQNVAFDALINASLLVGLAGDGDDGSAGWDQLATSHYRADAHPEFILRPPPGWPQTPDWDASDGASADLRGIHRRLYGSKRARGGWESVTYGEIVRAVERAFPPGSGDGTDALDSLAGRLLGAHGSTAAEQRAVAGARDQQAAALLADALSSMPGVAGCDRGMGGVASRTLLTADPQDLLIRALRAALRRALVPDHSSRRRAAAVTPAVSVDPARDRRAHVRRHLARQLGAPAPLLFADRAVVLRPAPDRSAAVYLDVSASMGPWAGLLHASLRPLHRLLAPRLFAFSTIIEELSRADFLRGRIRTTGGTDITPVLQHLTVEARAGRVRRALLLTDGYVGEPTPTVLRAFLQTGAQLHVVLTHDGWMRPTAWTSSVTRLPNIPTAFITS